MPSDGLVNGCFLPLLVLWVQPHEEEHTHTPGAAEVPPNLFNPPLNRCLPPPQLLEGNFALFCTYTLGFRNEFQNILLAIMVRMALRWSPSGLGLRWDGHSMGRGEGGCGAAMVCCGDSDRRSPGRRGGRKSCQTSCKGHAGWQEQRGLCSHVKAARDRETRSHGGLLSKSCHLRPFPQP